MGIKNGLAGITAAPTGAHPWPIGCTFPAADGGGAITDAVRKPTGSSILAAPGRPTRPGAKERRALPFRAPGAVQGFCGEAPAEWHVEALSVHNVVGHSLSGERSLALQFRGLRRASASGRHRTFIPAADPAQANLGGYGLKACPTSYPGQNVRARLSASAGNLGVVACQLYLQVYNADDQPARIDGPRAELAPGDAFVFDWRVPDTSCAPIAKVGVALGPAPGQPGAAGGVVYLDYLTWDGAPDVVFTRPPGTGQAWRHAWVDAVSKFVTDDEPMRLVQNDGVRLLIQGTAGVDHTTR